ncbi:streptogramin lyase [Hamadaea flava]|uniref:Uncharacterized protein n=1 Tax=Hamadaea flava TaxID=1742688 RepID=A0ABV8LSS8_9ACTN|nr:hypothetical protein [Hamadaea flava]MCP2327040.1 streptogramin lyase [Hamadaea flava]
MATILIIADYAVRRLDPATGRDEELSVGQLFAFPTDLAVEPTGDILVVDSSALAVGEYTRGAVIRIDRVTGRQTAVSSGGAFTGMKGIAVEASGAILVGNSPLGSPASLIRVDPATGKQDTVCQSDDLGEIHGIAVEADGSILVADAGHGQVWRVHPRTGKRKALTDEGIFDLNNGIAVEADGGILVTEALGDQYPGALSRLDPADGSKTLLAYGGMVSTPAGVTVDRDATILVLSRGAIPDEDGDGLGYPGIVRIDPLTGAQTLVSSPDSRLEEMFAVVVG